MSGAVSLTVRRAQSGTTEPAWVRYTLIAVALLFMLLFFGLALGGCVCRGLAQRRCCLS